MKRKRYIIKFKIFWMFISCYVIFKIILKSLFVSRRFFIWHSLGGIVRMNQERSDSSYTKKKSRSASDWSRKATNQKRKKNSVSE